MANTSFRDEPESVTRYRYCAFKARHSTGTAKARWEQEAKLAMEEAMSEKLQDRSQVRLVDRISSYFVSSEMNLRILSKKTLGEINEAIKYWENHLERTELTNVAKSVLRFQLRKLRKVKALMQSPTNTR